MHNGQQKRKEKHGFPPCNNLMMPTNLDRVRRADPKELARMLTEMIDQYICPLTDKDGADRTLDCANAILAWLDETNLPEVKAYV